MTRRLIASNQRPVSVGTFFSLGHSTCVYHHFSITLVAIDSLIVFPHLSIVIITSIVVAATASAISSKFSTFSRIGGIIGTSVSASFLIILGILNFYVLYKLIQQMQKIIATKPGEEQAVEFQGTGCLFRIFKKMFRLIDRSVPRPSRKK